MSKSAAEIVDKAITVEHMQFLNFDLAQIVGYESKVYDHLSAMERKTYNAILSDYVHFTLVDNNGSPSIEEDYSFSTERPPFRVGMVWC